MTNQQKASVLLALHAAGSSCQEELEHQLTFLGLSEVDKKETFSSLANEFENGIKHLNKTQLNNLLTHVKENDFSEDYITNRLHFYEVSEEAHQHILETIQWYSESIQPIEVYDLEEDFKGVQVATTDDFNTIIRQGYTGDWDFKPESIKTQRIQIASMNDSGAYPRGYYLNADIDRMELMPYGEKFRCRVFIKNPQIINSGNTNVKFTRNPVKHFE